MDRYRHKAYNHKERERSVSTELAVRTYPIQPEQKLEQVVAFYQAAHANQLPVALWRQPAASTYHAIIDLSGQPQPAELDFHEQTPAFVFSPFVKEQNSATLRLRVDLHLDADGLHRYNT